MPSTRLCQPGLLDSVGCDGGVHSCTLVLSVIRRQRNRWPADTARAAKLSTPMRERSLRSVVLCAPDVMLPWQS